MAGMSDVAPGTGEEMPHPTRADLFAQGPPRFPARFLLYLLGCVIVLGGGGVALDRAFSAAGLNPSSSQPAPTASTTSTGPPVGTPPVSAAPVAAGEPALMDLTQLNPRTAPPIPLSTGPSTPLGLDRLRGEVVVLTFFDEPCTDICPVIAEEITQADAYLGPAAGRVRFVTVNSDPLSADKWPDPARVFGGRPAPPNWMFATGTLAQLNRVWTDYGLTVDVVRSTGAVTHSDLLYFVDPTGKLRDVSTPFANEVAPSAYTLPPETVARWAHGIADVAMGLLK